MHYSAYNNQQEPYYPYSNQFTYNRDPYRTYFPVRPPPWNLTEPEPFLRRPIYAPVEPPEYSGRPYGVHGRGPFNADWRFGPGDRHFASNFSRHFISYEAGLPAAARATSVVRSSSSVLASAPSAKQAQKPYRTAAAGASSVVQSSSSGLASAQSAKQAQKPYRTAAAGASSVVQSSSSVLRQAPLGKQAQKPAAPSKRPHKVWCEICKIWCYSLEVLEDHKQGRQHMNKVKRHEKLQEQKAISGLHTKQTAATKSNLTDHALKVQEPEKNECPAGNMGSGVAAVSHKYETVVQNKQTAATKLNLTDQATKVQEPEKSECPAGNTGPEVAAVNHKDDTVVPNGSRETSAVPAEEPGVKKTSRNTIPVQHYVGKPKKKRKGSKLVKIAATALRRPVQNQITDLFIPFRCKLCNVRIESESAFQSHVNGDGHLSRLVRAPGQQALSGMFGLQVLYPPDINSLSKAINVQVQHGDNNPQLLLAKHLLDAVSQSQVAANSTTCELRTR